MAFVFTSLPGNQSLVLSLLSFHSWLFLALDLAQMVLKVQKYLNPTKLFIPNSFCFYNFAEKLIPWVVLAVVLLLAVSGPEHCSEVGPDGPGGPETT